VPSLTDSSTKVNIVELFNPFPGALDFLEIKESIHVPKPARIPELTFKRNNIQIIDLKFIDMPGIWQHLSVFQNQIDESSFTDGVPFDGSSIRGWKAINESDMTMVLDPDNGLD
jgi:hypothetical protein